MVPFVLCCLVFLVEACAWLGVVVPARDVSPIIGALEMIFLLALLAHSCIVRVLLGQLYDKSKNTSSRSHENKASNHENRPVLTVANWTLASLGLCILGDLVNRNFQQHFFARDDVIQHSYLVDSILFFAPGYACFIVAAFKATASSGALRRNCTGKGWLLGGGAKVNSNPQQQQQQQEQQAQQPHLSCHTFHWASLAIVCPIGAATFFSLVPAGCVPGGYVWSMTFGYTVLVSLMVPAGLWIALAFGPFGSGSTNNIPGATAVAVGAVLATVADAIIGHFWLFPEPPAGVQSPSTRVPPSGAVGHFGSFYPGVAYLNFVVYFASQAMVQKLPVVCQKAEEAGEAWAWLQRAPPSAKSAQD